MAKGVKRFDTTGEAGLVACPTGLWVRYSDYEKLEADRDAALQEAAEEVESSERVGAELAAERDQARQEVLGEVREGLLLLAITHFDHERLLTDENLDATPIFERGLLQQREVGQTGEYEAVLTAKGFDFLAAFLATLDPSGEQDD